MSIKVNFALKEETVKNLEWLTKNTYRRNKGDVIDWLAAEKVKELKANRRSTPIIDPQRTSEQA